MTVSVEMSRDEVAGHAIAVAAAETKEAFVTAFAACVRGGVDRETDSCEKIALFVHDMVSGQREMIAELVRRRGGGAA